VVVALCDNQNQGIVPVPASLGNGQVPGTNLYWGAAYGLRGFLPRHAGWRLVEERRAPRDGVLERVVLRTQSGAGVRTRDLYIVAEAWDGARMRDAIGRFLSIAAGGETESLRVDRGRVALAAGGASHLAVFVGHEGLMDFALEKVPHVVPGAPAEVLGGPGVREPVLLPRRAARRGINSTALDHRPDGARSVYARRGGPDLAWGRDAGGSPGGCSRRL
jgi:hypothetical protein